MYLSYYHIFGLVVLVPFFDCTHLMLNWYRSKIASFSGSKIFIQKCGKKRSRTKRFPKNDVKTKRKKVNFFVHYSMHFCKIIFIAKCTHLHIHTHSKRRHRLAKQSKHTAIHRRTDECCIDTDRKIERRRATAMWSNAGAHSWNMTSAHIKSNIQFRAK